ncbi:unnamed protein product, partial [Heterotrigona itama]
SSASIFGNAVTGTTYIRCSNYAKRQLASPNTFELEMLIFKKRTTPCKAAGLYYQGRLLSIERSSNVHLSSATWNQLTFGISARPPTFGMTNVPVFKDSWLTNSYKMNNYEDATRIITILNHITAFRNFVDQKKNQFKFICSCIWSILLIMIVIIQFRIEIHIIKTWFDIEYFIYMFQYCSHAFGYTSSMIIGVYQSKNALALVKQMDKVDKSLKKLGITIDYNNLFHHVKIIGFFWLLNAVIIYGMFMKWMVQNSPSFLISSTIVYVYMTNAQSIVLYDYNATIFWLKSRFKLINQLLKTYLLENDETKNEESNRKTYETSNNSQNRLETDEWLPSRSLVVSQVSSMNDTSSFKQGLSIDEKARLIQQIRFLHLQVCNVSKMVNHMFNAQILIYAFTMLIYISITIYFIYMEISKKSNIMESFDLILVFLFDGIVAILKIAVVSYDCECAMRQ